MKFFLCKKARGTLKNETPALMDIFTFQNARPVFSLFFLMILSGYPQEKLNFLPDDSHWVNTLRVRRSQNKCPSTLPQRILILGMLHSLRVTQHENG